MSQHFVISLLLLIIICASFVATSIWNISQQALAQPMAITIPPPVSHNYASAANSSFLSYQNKSGLGVAIQYPFNWKRIEADGKALIFLPPSKKDNFSETFALARFNINGNISAGQLSGAAINNYGEHYDDFFIIYSKPIAFEGDPAYILLYTYTNAAAGKIIAMDIGMKNGNKAYVISYSAQQSEYNIYVPTIEKMIDSIRLI